MKIEWNQIEKKHGDIDTFHIKIINFSIGITKIPKNFRLAAGPLPGDSLSGGQSPTAHCVGALERQKNIK